MGSFNRIKDQDMVRVIYDLLKELKVAESLVILFNLHKNNFPYWVQLKSALISSATNHRDLCFIATLVRASSKPSLSESCALIPGLLSFLQYER